MSDTRIVEGDSVYVQIDADDSVAVRGVVLSMPMNQGEPLIVKSVGGELYYIQQYHIMTRSV